MRSVQRTNCSGATTIEFALGLLIFLTFTLGIVDFSRMLFTWTAASEVTRYGARYAAVCDDKLRATEVRDHKKELLPQEERWTGRRVAAPRPPARASPSASRS
jgi:Flp pilus assembly protein TadG